MATVDDPGEIAAAIRELAQQVDALGNAVISAGVTIAKAIRPPAGSGGPGVSEQGTFT